MTLIVYKVGDTITKRRNVLLAVHAILSNPKDKDYPNCMY